jgi:solute carrier family 10 (sodium/bile acid cotransporter), member 7
LHALALTVTFVVFPLVGIAVSGLLDRLLASSLMLVGALYLCCLPSTIQSSVALVSSARGDVAAAVCTASASNLVGVFASPLLVGLILHAKGAGVSIEAVQSIVLQLLVPFVLGQLVRRWIGPWTERNRAVLAFFDRGTIVLLVYSAFSAAVVAGVWRQVSGADFAVIGAFDLALLCAALFGLSTLARRLGFQVRHEIVLTFCASQKGIAAGVPMAALIFPPAAAGMILLPVLIYHQFQLVGCALMARRYARRETASAG